MDLVEFLLARLDEDEAAARAAAARAAAPMWPPSEVTAALDDPEHAAWRATCTPSQAAHIARWDPARVFREVEAKRQIVGDHERRPECNGHPGSYMPHGDYCEYDCWECHERWPCRTLFLLAAIWADHSAYDPAWAPEEATRYG